MQIPKGVASPLSEATFVGALSMSRSGPQHEIADEEAWLIADANLNDPGFVRRRGPVTETASSSRATSRAIGITRCQDPAGVEQFLVLSAKTGSAASEVYGFGNTTITNMAWPYNCSVAPYELYDSKDALNAGVFIGTAPKYDKPTTQALALWRGAGKDDATAQALSAPITLGATTFTVTSATNFAPGQFVFKASQLVGVIKSISGTTITLEEPALIGASTNVDVQALRGVNPRVSKGRITTAVGSATVNGGQTKFKAQGLGTGTWDMYTPGKAYIGTVSAVASDTQLTLSSTAAVSLVNGAYVAIKRDGSYALTGGRLGFLNATFGGHQFFADGNTLRFSDLIDPEAVDLTEDGDSLQFSSDPIRAIIPGLDALVVVTETEAYALNGAVGTTPDRWRGDRILDDGTVCGMACMPYQGGALWTGKRGVWFWNGADAINVVGKLDDDYREFMSTFTSTTSRAYCAVLKDHYLIFVEGGKSGMFNVVKGATTTSITRPTFSVNLGTGAVAMWQNVEIRGFIQPPDSAGRGTCLMPITTTETGPTHKVRVLDGEQLFADSGQDAYLCEGAAVSGPDIYVETKKYSMGDGQRLKLFRSFLLHLFSVGGNIKLDYVPGLNTVGTTTGAEMWATTSWVNKRLKFNSRSQYVSLRLYQSLFQGDPASLVAANTTRVTFGQWALAFKWKKPGRL